MELFDPILNSAQTGVLLAFALAAGVVVAAGIRLSIYGDALGERTGLGRGIVGLVFLAAVTSLPELVVSITSVIQCANQAAGSDLSIGNMLGSNIFNLLILALVAMVFPRRFERGKTGESHMDSMLYGVVMLAVFSGAFLASGSGLDSPVPLLHCSWGTLLLPVAYAAILRREHRQNRDPQPEALLPSEQRLSKLSAPHFYGMLGLLSLLIVVGGIALSLLGSRMALPPEQGGFGLEASLIGTIFLAISTSLPELVISFASVRLGFVDMAIGNIMGSNLFNLLVVFMADTAMRGSGLLSHASSRHWNSVGAILLLTLLAGGVLHARKTAARIGMAVLMVVVYGVVAAFLVSSTGR